MTAIDDAGGAERATILVVDDSRENIHVLGELLRPLYTVRVALSAERALEAARRPPFPDLVLLDVMMPGMNGYDCLRRMREIPELRDTPVIFVTALDGDEDERLGLEMGAADYLTKPIRPAVTLARVRNILDMKRAKDSLAEHNAHLEEELDRLLEVLAHHLQEPVRRQMIYAQLLQRALPDGGGEAAGASLAEIIAGAARLRAMLRAMLSYLSAHQAPPPPAPCSAAAAFAAAREQLRGELAASAATVECGVLPAARVDADVLAGVFRALLSNAVAYARPGAAPRVRAWGEVDAAGHAVFSVEDEGIGIPPAQRERAFRLFERLHNDPTRPGAGIGLALVRAVAEKAGGRAWIEEGTQGGARVRFSVPAS